MNAFTLKSLQAAFARFSECNEKERAALAGLGAPGTSYAVQRLEHDRAKEKTLNALFAMAGLVQGIIEVATKHPAKWYDDRNNIADLLEWLEDRDELATDCIGHVCDILEKPWKWDSEYYAMRGEKHDTDPAPPMFAENDPFPAKRAR